MNNRIYISERDAKRIKALVDTAPRVDARTREYMARLEGELNRAKIVPEEKLPHDIITLNSQVELEDLSDGEIMNYTLVFPEEADPSEGKISILAPLGTGMLGYQAGDEFSWETPGGSVRMKVRKVGPRVVNAGISF
jgi:regulator of nucleoside diphosphate kinase